jgi:hypothetical protein
MNMKNNKVVIAVLLFCGLAWAATEVVDRVASVNPQHFLKGVYVGTAASRAVADTQNKISHSGAGQIDYVFPAVPDDGGATGDACQISGWGTTVEGATVGDPCMVGIGYGASGVPANDLVSDQFDCYVSASNTVKVRRCSMRGAGALIDAGYSVRTFSFR